MILIYSTQAKAQFSVINLILNQVDEIVLTAPNRESIPELIKEHRPRAVFLFMPRQTATAIDIQAYVKAVLPRSKVRILPAQNSDELLHPVWQEVVIKALKVQRKRNKHLRG